MYSVYTFNLDNVVYCVDRIKLQSVKSDILRCFSSFISCECPCSASVEWNGFIFYALQPRVSVLEEQIHLLLNIPHQFHSFYESLLRLRWLVVKTRPGREADRQEELLQHNVIATCVAVIAFYANC